MYRSVHQCTEVCINDLICTLMYTSVRVYALTAELTAIALLIAWSVVSFILSLFIFRWIFEKESKKLLSYINPENVIEKFEGIVHDKMQEAIDTFSEAFNEIMGQPTIKKAFTIIGKQGNDAQTDNLLLDTMATDFLNSPKFEPYMMAAEALGLDIEGYIETHGAAKTIRSIKQFAKIAGIDLMNLDLSSLATPLRGSGGGNNNPYIIRR